MSLSRREGQLARMPAERHRCRRFVPGALGGTIAAEAKWVDFALLLGSAQNGEIPPGGDVDLAVFAKAGETINWDRIAGLMLIVEDSCGAPCDLGILNTAGPVYRFEALRGRRLFVRPENLENYVDFFVRTCREYEEYGVTLNNWRKQRESVMRET
jgi:predicted nucleotidyltransferase